MAALDLMEEEWRLEYDPQGLPPSSLFSLTNSFGLGGYGARFFIPVVHNVQVNYCTFCFSNPSMIIILFFCFYS
jgi:hypothetical protein